MEAMNQRKALGVSLIAFAMLMLAVCLIYQVSTPSAASTNMWFSYLVGMVLCAIGLLMALL